MLRSLSVAALFALPVVLAVACGGSTAPVDDPEPDASGGSSSGGGSSGGGSSSGGSSGASSSGGLGHRVPKVHRAVAEACDGTRPNTPSNAPDGGTGPSVACQSHAECTEGTNGRCLGNPHDGWQCTYDLCKSDDDCGAGNVCQCGGGFRSDHDVCLESGCRIDADCGTNGYCSPSLGTCGNFAKFVTYACHQPTDECVDDDDCAAQNNGSCRFEPTVGHWKCSDSECAG